MSIKFWIGFLCGQFLVMLVLYSYPYKVIPVNEKLIEQGLAYHDSRTGDVKWKTIDQIIRENK